MQQSALMLTACFFAFTCIAAPDSYVYDHRVCEPGVNRPPPVISIGCEFPDLELGCPVDAPLTVTLRFKGLAGSTARLSLSNGSPELLERLSVSGNARRVNASTIEVRGDSQITGFSGTPKSVPQIEIVVRGADRVKTGTAQLIMTQLVGAHVIRETDVKNIYHACTAARQIGDRIVQNGFNSLRDAVVLIDGRRQSGCVQMESNTGQATVLLGNLLDNHDPLENRDCAARATIFTDTNAVAYRPALAVWTPNNGDKLNVTLEAPVIESVKFWLLYDPCVADPSSCPTDADKDAVKKWAETELAIAGTIYQQQFGGIAFKNLGLIDLTVANATPPASLPAVLGCRSQLDTTATLQTLQDIIGDTDPHQLNVIYVEALDPNVIDGVWCGVHDPGGQGVNTILIASYHYPRTPAHEVGHALLNSDHHAEAGVDGFTSSNNGQNLMRQGTGGDQLTIGQLFRANLDVGSAINRHHSGIRPTISCDNPTPANSCPQLAFDVRPR